MQLKDYQVKQGKKWEVRGYLGVNQVTGKEDRFKKRGFSTKKEAADAFIKAKYEYDNSKQTTKKPVIFNDVYDTWFKGYQTKGVKPSTIRSTESIFRLHILPKFGHMKLTAITTSYCQDVVIEWSKEFSTYKRYARLTKEILEWATNDRLIEVNPFNNVILPMTTKNNEKKENVYTKEELNYFLDVARMITSNKKYTYFYLLFYTGTRRSEALALRWSSINWENKTLEITKSVSKDLNNKLILDTPKTDSSIRTVFIDDKFLEVLRKWKDEQEILLSYSNLKVKKDEDQLIFQNECNDILQTSSANEWQAEIYNRHDDLINKIINEETTTHQEVSLLQMIIKKHKKEVEPIKRITVHGCRHTHATLLSESGATALDVSKQLGHKKMATTTDIYIHNTDSRISRTGNLLSSYMNETN